MIQDDRWTDVFPMGARRAPLSRGETEGPPVKEHPPELVVCAYCGYVIEDAWWRFHPCPEREAAQRERERLDNAPRS